MPAEAGESVGVKGAVRADASTRERGSGNAPSVHLRGSARPFTFSLHPPPACS